MKVVVALVVLPPPAGVALYSHVGKRGGGGDGGGGDGGGGEGGADGGWQVPSQSTMYSTYTKLSSYLPSSTAGVAVVTKVYVPSGLGGSATILAHSKKEAPLTTEITAAGDQMVATGLHLPCTFSPLAIVCMMNSSGSS